ncbi:MAG: 3'-5' exonuclease [Thermodesulfobacteriota bacterium]|nr:3'-5' exonuclease [Thermodesulfobacteriota bacterium]
MWKSLLKNIAPRKKEYSIDPLQDYIETLCEQIRSRSVLKMDLREASYCIIDLETTGLDLTKDVIINAAAVKIKSGRITKIYETYINPPFPIPPESIQWHGITDDMLVDKPAIGEVLLEFLNFVGDSLIVGHHINFDINMLNRHLGEFYDCNLEGTPWLDTMLLHKLVMENNTSTELDDLLNVYVIDCDERHRALGDSIATAKVFLRILQELSLSYQTLGDLFRAQQDMSRKDNM